MSWKWSNAGTQRAAIKIAILIGGILIICACLVEIRKQFVFGPGELSPFTGPEAECISGQTEQSAYAEDVQCIVVTVYNDRNATVEFGCPQFEVWYKEAWHQMKFHIGRNNAPTAMALCVRKEQSDQFTLYLQQYGTKFQPGHYRAVFEMLYEDSYISAEFDIV